MSRFGRMFRWVSKPRDILVVCYVLLTLYALPLFIVLFAFLVSSGFTVSSRSIDFSIALAGLYASEIRETLGTFVIPFITAYAVAGVQKERRVEARTLWLFFSLTTLFLISVVVYSAVQTQIDVMLSQTALDADRMMESKDNFLNMSSAYVKELLVYISLLIGITQAGSLGERK